MRFCWKWAAALLIATACCFAQEAQDKAESPEDKELGQSLSEASTSPMDYSRALEKHLKKYPNSPRKAELERILAQAALDLKDNPRLLKYGVPVIEGGNRSPQLMSRVTSALLAEKTQATDEKALKFAQWMADALEKGVQRITGGQEDFTSKGRRLEETQKTLSRAYLLQATALSRLKRGDEAIEFARKSAQTYPNEISERELSRLLAAAGKNADALNALANAMVLSDESPDTEQRRDDRERLAKLAADAGGPARAGEALVSAYARTAASVTAYKESVKKIDPNVFAEQPSEFVLSALDGPALRIDSLKGKVVVLDFWATWCGPCRAQHPLYEQTQQRFKSKEDVVFLAISTDEERELVGPFLDRNKWSRKVYFEDGLGTLMKINSIPTTVILSRDGDVFSRMVGYNPERFVDQLSDRIRDALEEK